MYCVNCGKKIKDKTVEKCPYCSHEIVKGELSYEQTRELNKNLHSRLTKSREGFDSGMVFVVLGATLFIIGLIFFSLSYKVPDDPDVIGKVIKTSCFEFWVSMAGLSIGGTMLVFGSVRVIIEKLFIQRELKYVLNEVQQNRFINE